MAKLEYCPRCRENWNASGGYHICAEDKLLNGFQRVRAAVFEAAAAEMQAKYPHRDIEAEVANLKGFVKHDANKEVYALIDEAWEAATAKVLTVGSRKYTDDNWKQCKTPWRTYYSALRRHLAACARGDTVDPESGQSHLVHATCCLMFLHWFESNGGFEKPCSESADTGGTGSALPPA